MNKTLNKAEWNNEPCWLWPKGKDKDGYRRVYMHKSRLAHRLMYETFVGKIPQGLCVLHFCDVPSCVNPVHLFLGTIKENNADRAAKGRNGFNPGPKPWTHCKRGHLFDEVNTGWYTNGSGKKTGKLGRYCRTCHSDWRNRNRGLNGER